MQAQQENTGAEAGNGQNKLDMLEMLLTNDLHQNQGPQSQMSPPSSAHSIVHNQFSSMLPSEPQVMRTKRMGHRKASSISYMIPGSQAGNSNFSSNGAAQFQPQPHHHMGHNRTNSLTGIQDLNPDTVTDFLFQAATSNNSNHGGSPPDSSNNDVTVNNNSTGHRRFHSMGNIVSPYAFPQQQQQFFNQAASNPAATFAGGHQKSMSGTSVMFEEFNALNMAMKKDTTADMMMPGMRPLRRLHPLMNEQMPMDSASAQAMGAYSQTFAAPTQSYYNDGGVSNMYVPQQQHQSVEESAQELYFDDETGLAEDGYRNDDEFEQVITVCSWEGCNLEKHSQDALVAHILQDHVGTGKASYVCEWAGCSRLHRPFTKRHKIQNHVRIHTGERPFACPVSDCGKKFSRQDGLNTHIKTHSSVKPYVCSYPPCGKAYFHSRSLRKHERTHLENGAGGETQFMPAKEQANVVDSSYMYQAAPSFANSYQQQMPMMNHHKTPQDGYLMGLASLTSPTHMQPSNTMFAGMEHQMNHEHQMPHSYVWEA